ncbi:tape measure protein [Blautia hydrogenotrophica]|uniref:tape measure protein n=1 Tax=Blautia hydrogenotrophica TaxID=53443 RepID=UPI0023F149D4|nr:tape measure protein [Blautia hydrogenotrophica]
MAESFSIRAVLSAADRGFSSAMKNAQSSISNLKSVVTGGLGFGVLAGIGQSAFSAIAGNVKSLGSEVIGTSDSMQKLQQAMRFSGTSESEIQRIAGATGTLKTYADQTVFSLNDVMSTFGALSANGIQDADRMVESVGNAVAVFGGGAEEFSRVGLAFSQAMAAGALHAEDWNQILDASPQLAGGLKKELVKLNPVLGNDFKGAMEEGAITAELLGQAMNNIGMTDMAKDAASSVTTFEGAMGNLEATVTTGMGQIYDSFAKAGVVSSINKLSDAVSKAFPKISGFIVSLQPYWEKLESAGSRVGQAFSSAFSAVLASFSKTTGKIGGDQSVAKFGSIVEQVSEKLIQFAGFLEKNADAIAKVIPHIPKLAAGFAGLKILSVVSPMLGGFVKSIGRLAAAGIGTIASRLFGISRSQEQVGRSSSGSSKKILASAKAFLLMGAGVAMISGGFYLLAQSATGLADAGGVAIAVMFGLVGAVGALGFGMTVMLKSITAGPGKLRALGTTLISLGAAVLMISGGFAVLSQASIALANAGMPAIATMFGLVAAIGALMVVASKVGVQLTAGAVGMVAFGAAVLIAGAGMALMSQACVNLVSAGTPAIAVMAGMVVALAGLMALAAVLGPMLTAGAVGMLAFGTALVLVATSALIGSAALAVVAGVLPTVSQYGASGAVAIAQLGAAMIVFATGAATAGAASIVLGAGLLIAGTGATATAATLLGAGLPMVATGATAAAAGLTAMLGGATALSAILLLLTASMAAFSAVLLLSSAGLITFGASVTLSAAGAALLATSLVLVSSSVKSIASNAKSAESSLSSMVSSVNIVESGLNALKSVAGSAMDGFINAFKSGNKQVTSEAKSMANGIKNNLETGLNSLSQVARTAMSRFTSGLNQGGAAAVSAARSISANAVAALGSSAGVAYSHGYNIGAGFANGMAASLGRVQNIASQMAAAAAQAIAAKAKIGSPSKVTYKQGLWVGEGFVNGIKSMINQAWSVSEDLVSIPNLAIAGLGGFQGELSEAYSYSRNITIIVPFDIDGREFARAEAQYMDDELGRLQTRSKRLAGRS